MPTYVVTAAVGRLSASQKQAVVEKISQVHSQEGGNVPEWLVQVVFNEIQAGNHFINKRLVPADQVWVIGNPWVSDMIIYRQYRLYSVFKIRIIH
jgi:phenylpyruvate tautomerase PptA (4-oxalocrotonate tautomerase family)